MYEKIVKNPHDIAKCPLCRVKLIKTNPKEFSYQEECPECGYKRIRMRKSVT